MVGGALVLLVFRRLGWQAAVGLVLLFNVLLLLQVWFYREPEADTPPAAGFGMLFVRMIGFWRLPGRGAAQGQARRACRSQRASARQPEPAAAREGRFGRGGSGRGQQGRLAHGGLKKGVITKTGANLRGQNWLSRPFH